MLEKAISSQIEKITTASPEETARFAGKFARRLQPGEVVAFYGDLGSGKTFFIQHLCRALGCAEVPTSPTFIILNVYHTAGGMEIYHFDFYRLEHEAELANIGLEDYFYGEGICLIEWADKIASFLPLPRYDIRLHFVPGAPEARTIEVVRIE